MNRKREIESFIVTFALFIIFGGIDNSVWNFGTTPIITSIVQVLTNRVDLFVAIVFAIVVTYLTDWVRLRC